MTSVCLDERSGKVVNVVNRKIQKTKPKNKFNRKDSQQIVDLPYKR